MTKRTKWMLWIGAALAGFTTAILSEVFVGPEVASLVGGIGMLTFCAFAFADSAPRAIWMIGTGGVLAIGIGYFRYVRQDALGVTILVIAALLGLGLVAVGRRTLA